MRSKLIRGGSLLAAGAVTLWWLAERRATERTLDELRDEVSSLRHTAARSEPVMRRWASPAAEASAPSAAAEPAARDEAAPHDEDSPRDLSAPPDPIALASAEVERSFQRERLDSGWAAQVQQQLAPQLAALASRSASAVRDVQCRSSICRVEISYRDREAARAFTDEAFTPGEHRLWRGPYLMAPLPEQERGPLVATLYLGREDTDLLAPVAAEPSP